MFARARAIATRWRWPPESCAGQDVRLLGDPDLLEELERAAPALLARDARVEERQLDVAARSRPSAGGCSSGRRSRSSRSGCAPGPRRRGPARGRRRGRSEPPVGESRQPMIAISVDLPEPDGPTSATNSPRSTVRSMPRRACTAVPLEPKTLVRPRVSMIARSVVVVLLDLLLRRVLERDLLGPLEAGADLDALEGRDAGLDGDDVVVVLPVVREPDVLAAAVQPLPSRPRSASGERLSLRR